MRAIWMPVALLALPLTTFAVPASTEFDAQLAQRRDDVTYIEERTTSPLNAFIADISELWKRKGGGGGGGKGGGGGSSSGSGKGGGSSSSSGKGGSSSSSSGGRGSSSSIAGGSTKTGSGPAPRFGGFYGGGARQPYTSGGRSPSGISPVLLGAGVGVGVGAGIGLAAYPGFWPYGAYAYPYAHPYTFHNRTRNRTATSTSATPSATHTTLAGRLMARQDDGGVLQTSNVTCLCAQFAVCGCDDNNNSTFLDMIIGDGSYASLNKSLVNVATINGTDTIVLNGTLPNGTTAPGGTENANAAATYGANYWMVWLLFVGIAGLL